MAMSLAFGLASTTVLALILVPVMYFFLGKTAREQELSAGPGGNCGD